MNDEKSACESCPKVCELCKNENECTKCVAEHMLPENKC